MNLESHLRMGFLVYPMEGRSYDEAIELEIRTLYGEPLRWAVLGAWKRQDGMVELDIETTVLAGEGEIPRSTGYASHLTHKKSLPPRSMVILHVVPTGIGAAVGGALGDAMPVNHVLAKMGAIIVGHPNIYNGGPYNVMDGERMCYVEGRALDQFFMERLILEPVVANRIGIVIGRVPGDTWAIDNAQNQIYELYAHAGLYISGIEITEKPVGGEAVVSAGSNAMSGEVENIETVRIAAKRLVEKGADVLAIFTHVDVPEKYWQDYFTHSGFPNPVGAVEANISRAVSYFFGIPVAHAPMVTKKELDFLQSQGVIQTPAAGDAAVPFYVGSVLRGLQHAPRLVSPEVLYRVGEALHVSSVNAVICPATSMGGIPMMRADARGIPIIGVRQNATVLNVTARNLGITHALEVETYVEAIGLLEIAKEIGDFSFFAMQRIIAVHRTDQGLFLRGIQVSEDAGINPETLIRPLSPIR